MSSQARLVFASCAVVLCSATGAQTASVAGDAAASAVSLSAPPSVRALLVKHLDLPAQLAGDDAQLVLTRRAGNAAAALLATEGYFAPRIEVRRTDGDAAGLVIDVDPGPRTTVAAVVIEFTGDLAGEGAERSARRERLRKEWPLKAGAVFRSADWTAAKAALLASVAADDHAAARLADSRAEIDPAAATARLEVVIEAGPAYRFGALAVEGLKRYDAKLVQGLASFAPGDAYRRDALLNFQTILQNTPWFHSVMVEADPLAATGDVVPVRVTLEETQSRRVGFGLGYGTNSGARSELNYRNHDFLGRAWDLNSALRADQNRQTLFADLSLVPDARGYRLGFGGRLEHSDIEGLASTRQVLAATRSRVKGNIETRFSLEWQRETVRPDGAEADTDTALVLDWRWIRRAVDDPLRPRRGNVIDFRLGGASKQLLSARDFVRTHVRLQQWFPLGEHDSLALRGELGFTAAASRAGIPQDYLFRSGGAQTVRGHAYQSLGVREGDAVVGGRAMLVGSVEYTHWFGGPWGAALFVDAGDAADRWRDLRPATGIGAGVRWQSPVGPLAVDLARGSRSGRWYPHFSLMVAF